MTWSDAVEARERSVADQLAPVMPPCPAWCVDDKPHLIAEGVDTSERSVTYDHYGHVRVAAVEDCEYGQPVDWRIQRWETVRVNGTVDKMPTLILPRFKGDHGFTSAQARQIAAAMLNAADELDRLTS